MAAQDDLVTSLKAIMAARLEELGGPPTPEELLAYRDGGLETEEREKIEARIAACPDAARALADLAAFPAVEAAPGTPELSDEDVRARWQSFRRGLPDRPLIAAPNAAEKRRVAPMPPMPPVAPIAAAPLGSQRRYPRWWLSAAALLGIGLGWAGGFAQRTWREHPGSSINVQIVELSPRSEGVRSEPSVVALPVVSEELLLVLGGREHEERDFSLYEVEAVDPAGRRVWSRSGLRPTALGTFHVSFQRGALGPGRYRIDLFGRDGERRTPLASYDLRFLDDAETH